MPAIRRQGRRFLLLLVFQVRCFGLGVPAPLRRARGFCVSPPRATYFGKRRMAAPPKVGKGLAPDIRFFA